jgi:type IV pilus assembly protein PilB
MAIRRLGQILVDLGYITDEQLDMLLAEQRRKSGELLGKLAESLGLITDEQLAEALAEQMAMRVVTLSETTINPKIIEKVTEPMAQLYRIIPIDFRDDTLTIVTCEPQKLSVQDELRTLLGYNIRACVATEKEIAKALERYYASNVESLEKLVKNLENDKELYAATTKLSTKENLDEQLQLADSEPVRKLLNMVLLMAIKDHASDLHFEPFEDEFRIRIKADGVLFEMVPPPRHMAAALVTRIKVMANLDIAERRLPQDGRIELTIFGFPVDLRVSVLPTMFGESVVMRVLDRSVVSLDLAKCGMNDGTMKVFKDAINKPNGIILVTGPTGSGKTTTLYSALSFLNSIEDKIITTEDPVEYDIDGIVQVPIDSSIGVTFASALRAILRQDPDRILVGEIRDYETAEIAIQASLTGHTVFSTLHTNDAPSTITRLRDMGVQPFLITATVEAILAQRLVRRVCAGCKEEVQPSAEVLVDLDLKPEELKGKKFYRGKGCDVCNRTGYKGRVGLFELMIMNDDLRDMIIRNCTTDELRDAAQKYGMITLRKAGMDAVYGGLTTAEEVIRETILEA